MSDQTPGAPDGSRGATTVQPRAPGTPHPIDEDVGRRVLTRRKQLGMSQDGLATALGLTFQQVQKYERGKNRISASRLQQIADILSVPVSYFFDEPGQQPQARSDNGASGSELDAFLASTDGHELADAFSRIRDSGMKRSIVAFVERIAEEHGEIPLGDGHRTDALTHEASDKQIPRERPTPERS